MKRANANKTKQARHDSKVCAPLLDNFVIRPRDLYYRVRSCLSRKDGKKKFKIWSISLPSPIVPIAETKRSLAQCRSRVEAPDKSRIQSFEFIRSIIFCRKLFLKRESYFSSAAYDLLSVFLGYYSVFSTNHTKARPKENSVYPFSLLVSFSKFFPFGERISSISRWGGEGKNK